MAIAYVNGVAGTTSGGGDTNTTGAVNMTGATALYAVVSGRGTPTVSDSLSNTWSYGTYLDTGDGFVQLAYVLNATVGSSQTFTNIASGFRPGIAVAGFSGVATSGALDQQSTATGDQPGSITPTENDELVIQGYGGYFSAGVPTCSGYTVAAYGLQLPGDVFAAAIAYLIQTTAGATNPTWANIDNARGAVAASFKAAGGGGGGGKPTLYYAQQRLQAQ